MKNYIIWTVISVVIFLAIPFFMIKSVTLDANLPFALFYLFILCPVYFFLTGYMLSKDFKKMWILPILGLFFFMIVGSLLLGMDIQSGLFYLIIYLVIIIVSYFISIYLRKSKYEDEEE